MKISALIRSSPSWLRTGLPTFVLGLVALPFGLPRVPSPVRPGPTALALRDVTVIDVTTGERHTGQTVLIVGNRIKAVGLTRTVKVPSDAQVVDARGKYLIPGLWDMHSHREPGPSDVWNGVTGIRRPGGRTTLDSLRQAIHAGTLVGPRSVLGFGFLGDSLLDDSAGVVNGVDSAKQMGFYFVKTTGSNKRLFYILAAEARRVGIRFGGHLEDTVLSVLDVLDSGVTDIDHTRRTSGGLDRLCIRNRNPKYQIATLATCRQVAARMRRNDAWWIPTLADGNTGVRTAYPYPGLAPSELVPTDRSRRIQGSQEWWRRPPKVSKDADKDERGHKRCPSRENWLRDSARFAPVRDPRVSLETNGMLTLPYQAGLPLLAGTDGAPRAIHIELALMVSEGLPPLAALQTATLNPAKYLHATDSLGTVAPGKVADLVLLDADPLVDITNTTTIWAVIADGHYYDRAALDKAIDAC